MNLTCPRCSVDMKKIHVRNVELDLCESCEGLWFDRDEIGQVAAMGEEEAAASPLAPSLETDKERLESPGKGDLKCPRCGSEMYRYIYMVSSGVVVDGCEKGCGVWLDDGEIRKIIEYSIESERALDPETERMLREKLQAVKREARANEEKFIDSLVLMDNRPGLMRYPGKVLQCIYRCFYKMGL